MKNFIYNTPTKIYFGKGQEDNIGTILKAYNAKKQAKDLAVPIEKLMEWKRAIIWLLLQQVKKYVDDSRDESWRIVKDIDVANTERILRMFKTELWEPSTIGTNYNLNANKNDLLTDEEIEALDLLFEKSQNWKKSKQQ